MGQLNDQQLKSNDCGISAVKTICNLLNVNISRDIIEDSIHLDSEGASLGSLNKFFTEYGFKANYRLLDINSINGNAAELKEWFPCITPVRSSLGWHFIVINDIKSYKFHVLDPAETRPYRLSVEEFKKKAYYSSSNLKYVDLESLLQAKVKEELDKYSIKIDIPPSHQELTEMFNKLSYFTHVKENFGFKDEEAAQRFLNDLLFHQELKHIPKHFQGLNYKKGQVKIKAPVLLSVKKTEQTQSADSGKSSNPYWRLYKSIAGIKELWFIFLFTAILASVIGYVGVFINQILIDHILPSYQINTLQIFAIGVGIFYLIDTIFYVYKKYISIHLSNALDRYFLSQFDSKLTNYSVRYLQGYKRGDLTERLRDVMRLKSFFTRYFSSILVNVITALFSLIFLLLINWQLTFLVLIVLVLFCVLFYVFTPIIASLERQRYMVKASFMSRFIEKIDGIQVIKALGLEAYSSNQIRAGIDDMIRIQTKSKYVGMANSVLTSLIISFSSLTLLVLTSRQMIVHNSISLGMIITFLALSGKIFRAFGSLLDKNLSLQEHKVILNRFFDFDENKSVSTPEEATKEEGSQQKFTKQRTYNQIKEFEFKSLSLKNVAFTYDDEKFILNDISLDINRGEKIWIRGENGTGKSTMCKIMGMLYQPSKGEMLLNDIDISLYPKERLRRKIVFISGEDLLFNESLLFNITFGRKVDMERLIEFAKVINFYDFINKKSDKFDFIVHENGRNLSTGQRKKVLLLRALMTNTDLIILDEIFNGIDQYSKERAETLISLMDDRAFIIISHMPIERISFNQKFILNNGSLLQQNT